MAEKKDRGTICLIGVVGEVGAHLLRLPICYVLSFLRVHKAGCERCTPPTCGEQLRRRLNDLRAWLPPMHKQKPSTADPKKIDKRIA